jgi:phthalate 4,5-cis-dihydrodiol dehydrogenase
MAASSKHVIFDKIIAATNEGADRTVAAGERTGHYLGMAEPHGSSAAVRGARQIIESGRLGPLRMLHSWVFVDWDYRPRSEDELNPDLPEGVLVRQGPHQFDALRVLGGGRVKTVRGMTGVWDRPRRIVGAYTAYLNFEDGIAATAASNGYDHLIATDFQLYPAGGDGPAPSTRQYARARKAVTGLTLEQEATMLRPWSAIAQGLVTPATGGGGARSWPINGPLVACCEKGDIVLAPQGLVVYGEDEIETIAPPRERVGGADVVHQLYEAITTGRQPVFDGRWGRGTLEVILGVAQSGRDDREVQLSRQVALPAREAVAS